METLEMEATYRLVLPPADPLTVVLVGVGGTGSALAPALARLAHHLRGIGVTMKMFFVDHDTIESRNILRQNYSASEVGYPKADALAFRLSALFGLPITSIPTPFSAARFGEWAAGCERRPGANLIVAAVDNHLARREIAEVVAAQDGRWHCLELANEHSSGQVLLGNVVEPEAIKVDKLGLCSGLPSPYLQEPMLLEPPPADANPLSCADLTLRGGQSPVVNQMVAAIAADYAYQFLVRREVAQMATYFALAPTSVKSVRLTETSLAAFSSSL